MENSMPTEDICQPEVVVALQKDGWTITGQQIYIPKPDLYVFIDIEAAKEDSQAYIEVKCFPDANSTTEFYTAIGQYLVYRQVIATERPGYRLYLAVPEDIFDALGETYRDTIRDNRVKIIVVNLEAEFIVQWIE
jgi:hypothetical protein